MNKIKACLPLLILATSLSLIGCKVGDKPSELKKADAPAVTKESSAEEDDQQRQGAIRQHIESIKEKIAFYKNARKTQKESQQKIRELEAELKVAQNKAKEERDAIKNLYKK